LENVHWDIADVVRMQNDGLIPQPLLLMQILGFSNPARKIRVGYLDVSGMIFWDIWDRSWLITILRKKKTTPTLP